MSALTPEQEQAVRAIAAEMIGQALAGVDSRVRAHVPTCNEPDERQVRLACLQIAAQVIGRGTDPRHMAEELVHYVLRGITPARRPTVDLEVGGAPTRAAPISGAAA